ncbi:hypothetical protein L2E82_28674 [Cichorium intybus]|uniref:Uncharacterized protein n=1 Tax=Cichorium intybus TaxID=13427 RepID=A0ACB9CWF4_CICIN|nr:hypothetical protein L2E82_28674 [Cichorium intybus]
MGGDRLVFVELDLVIKMENKTSLLDAGSAHNYNMSRSPIKKPAKLLILMNGVRVSSGLLNPKTQRRQKIQIGFNALQNNMRV